MFKNNKRLNKHILHKNNIKSNNHVLYKNNTKLNKHILHRNNKKTWKKVIISIIFILCVIFAGLVMNKYLGKMNTVSIDKSDPNVKEDIFDKEHTLGKEDTIVQNNDIKNITLFGIDETEGAEGRSNCIMILTIDNKHKKLKLSSIIRDSYVEIPTIGKRDEINHTYAFGSSELAIKTLNENFDLNLDKFVVVNFSSLPKIINCIGGITLDITNDELKYINGYINNLNYINGTTSPNITTSGSQKIDGTQALAYCRIRYTVGEDFERNNRQRAVLIKLIEQCSAISPSQYANLLDEIHPLVHTNLEKSEILSLTMNFNDLKDHPLFQDSFPRDDKGNGKLIGGIYYYVFDEA